MTFIKIYRKILDWEWYSDINTTRLFFHLLIKVNYKDQKYKGKIISRGSYSTTVSRLADETNLTIREVRTALNHLKSTGEIEIKTTNRESIIKVLHYHDYQAKDSDERQTNANQTPIERQSNDERTDEEGKEYKELKEIENVFLSEQTSDEQSPPKKEKVEKAVKVFTDDCAEMKLSLLLFKRMQKNNPDCKEPNFQGWCKHVDRMIRIDGRTPRQIQKIIIFSQQDSFWMENILSTFKLRKQFDQLAMRYKNQNLSEGKKSAAQQSSNPFKELLEEAMQHDQI